MRHQREFDRNTGQLRTTVTGLRGVKAVPRDGGIVWRLAYEGVVVDYWPSTGVARVIQGAPVEQAYASGREVVWWLYDMKGPYK